MRSIAMLVYDGKFYLSLSLFFTTSLYLPLSPDR